MSRWLLLVGVVVVSCSPDKSPKTSSAPPGWVLLPPAPQTPQTKQQFQDSIMALVLEPYRNGNWVDQGDGTTCRIVQSRLECVRITHLE